MLSKSKQQMEKPEKFTWVINDFSKLTLPRYYSRRFTIGGCNWSLLVYPKGGRQSDCVSLYLVAAVSDSSSPQWQCHARFTLSVPNRFNDNHVKSKEADCWFSASLTAVGCESLIGLSILLDPSIGYLVNDTLTIEVEVVVLEVVGIASDKLEVTTKAVELLSRTEEDSYVLVSGSQGDSMCQMEEDEDEDYNEEEDEDYDEEEDEDYEEEEEEEDEEDDYGEEDEEDDYGEEDEGDGEEEYETIIAPEGVSGGLLSTGKSRLPELSKASEMAEKFQVQSRSYSLTSSGAMDCSLSACAALENAPTQTRLSCQAVNVKGQVSVSGSQGSLLCQQEENEDERDEDKENEEDEEKEDEESEEDECKITDALKEVSGDVLSAEIELSKASEKAENDQDEEKEDEEDECKAADALKEVSGDVLSAEIELSKAPEKAENDQVLCESNSRTSSVPQNAESNVSAASGNPLAHIQNAANLIFEKHPDLLSNFRPKNRRLRSASLFILVDVIKLLCRPPKDISLDDLSNASDSLTDLEDLGLKVDWLKKKLEEVSKRKEKAGGSRLNELNKMLDKWKLAMLKLESAIEKEKAEIAAAGTALSFSYVV